MSARGGASRTRARGPNTHGHHRTRTPALVCSRALTTCVKRARDTRARAGQNVPQFDLQTALTKKEKRVINKAEYMIPYHMARCPNYGWKESEQYASAEALKDRITGIEGKAKKRWEMSFV